MHCECLRLADWPLERQKRRLEEGTDEWMDGLGLVPMLLWTEWVSGGNMFHLCFLCGSVRMGKEEVPTCLALRLGGSSSLGLTRKGVDWLVALWSVTHEPNPPSPPVTV